MILILQSQLCIQVTTVHDCNMLYISVDIAVMRPSANFSDASFSRLTDSSGLNLILTVGPLYVATEACAKRAQITSLVIT